MIFHFSFRALSATCLIVAASFALYGCGGGSAGNLLEGAFYGPAHAETAGIVVQQGIVGAFGASKQ